MSKVASESDEFTYLEDIQSVSKTISPEALDEDAKTSNTSTVNIKAVKKAEVSGSLKRQRTIMEMMSSGSKPKDSETERLSKKTKTVMNESSESISSATTTTNTASPPKPSGKLSLNSIPFSMVEFLESLTEEEKSLLALECETMGKSWLKVLKDEVKKSYFIQLKKFLWQEGVKGPGDPASNVYPAPKNIYSWSHTPLGRLKVVIIGQDPYHGPNQAHGLCFSVPHGVKVPPSLLNIYKELKAEYPTFSPPKHGNLTEWSNSGVLLLNTALTVRAGKAGSHSNKGWEEFTDKVIEVVDKYGGANLASSDGEGKTGLGRGIVFLAWGNWAAKRVAKLNKTKHLILLSAHPSPLSASRGFLGNGHFKKANEWLEARYGKAGVVDWCKLDSD